MGNKLMKHEAFDGVVLLLKIYEPVFMQNTAKKY